MKNVLAIATLILASAVSAHAANLTNSKGFTVYTYDPDQIGVSHCYGECANDWPPVLADGSPIVAPYSEVVRKDGAHQLAYRGKPIYTYEDDSKPGDANGDGLGGVWHVVIK